MPVAGGIWTRESRDLKERNVLDLGVKFRPIPLFLESSLYLVLGTLFGFWPNIFQILWPKKKIDGAEALLRVKESTALRVGESSFAERGKCVQERA